MKISVIISAFVLLFASTGVFATSTAECVDLTPNQVNSHDLNAPEFNNCYLIDNESNDRVFVSVMMVDGLEGALEIQRYNSSTGQYTPITTESTQNGVLSYIHDQDIGSDSYYLRLGNLTHPSDKKKVTVGKSVYNGTIHVVITIARYAEEEETSPPSGGGGFCDPTIDVCFEPLGGGFEMYSTQTQTAGTTCTGELAPQGFHEDYDIEEWLEYAEGLMNAHAARTIGFGQAIRDQLNKGQRAVVFAVLMAPTGTFDFKRPYNPYHTPDGEAAGNYNYGYMGTELGFDAQTLRNMSGVIQLIKAGSVDLADLQKAIMENDWTEFDAPQDQEEIDRGISASESGCVPSSSSSSYSGGSGGSADGFYGWGPSITVMLSFNLCSGCTVTIIDRPPGGFPDPDESTDPE